MLISTEPTTFYSGMVPGWIAGHYRASDGQIDLASVAARAGASLIVSELIGASMERQTIALAGGEELPFDWLSIGTGGTDRSAILGDVPPSLIPLRPIERFADQWVQSNSSQISRHNRAGVYRMDARRRHVSIEPTRGIASREHIWIG